MTATPRYLLALGDSLAAGYEPSFGNHPPPIDPTTGYGDLGYPAGYAADLAAAEHLSLFDLACPGETSATMLASAAETACATTYRAELGVGSQEAAAEAFLDRHRGQVSLVTIDIGSNDVDGCFSRTAVNASCVARGEATITVDLPTILSGLRAALRRDDPAARLLGMTYYDPFLAASYSPGGTRGILAALSSLGAAKAFNTQLNHVFGTNHIPVADVAGAFRTNSVYPPGEFNNHILPADVIQVCRLTWMCPLHPAQTKADIHPNATGYKTIAGAFEQLLGSPPS